MLLFGSKVSYVGSGLLQCLPQCLGLRVMAFWAGFLSVWEQLSFGVLDKKP